MYQSLTFWPTPACLSNSTHNLSYDLDVEDGVSKTPVINFYQYESQLNHLFLPGYKTPSSIQPLTQSQIKATSSGVRNY